VLAFQSKPDIYAAFHFTISNPNNPLIYNESHEECLYKRFSSRRKIPITLV